MAEKAGIRESSVKFTILGEPKGKGRPRVVSHNGFSRAYTPKDTAMYENLVRLEYELASKGFKFADDDYISIVIDAFYSIPKSVSKKKREQMLKDNIKPTKKPDADNILKICADSLNQLAYKDDSQIVFALVTKRYSENPRVEVTLMSERFEDGKE